MVKKFNEMFENSFDKRINDMLNSEDNPELLKKKIIEEIESAYKAGFEYAWTKGANVYTANDKRRKKEKTEFENEKESRFQEYLKSGGNYKSGRLLHDDSKTTL